MYRPQVQIIYAVDVSDFNPILCAHLEKMAPYIDIFKIGLEAMTAEPDGYRGMTAASLIREFVTGVLKKQVMWDIKLLDISNTVSNAVKNIIAWKGVKFFTVHATASEKTLRSVIDICARTKTTPLAITLLTDMDNRDSRSCYREVPDKVVLKLVERAKKCGFEGFVCAPQDLAFLQKHRALEGMAPVVPGTRSAGVSANDQARVITPEEAVKCGARYLVVGREFSKAQDPSLAAKEYRDRVLKVLA